MRRILAVILSLAFALALLAGCQGDQKVYTGTISGSDFESVQLSPEAQELLENNGDDGNIDDFKHEESEALPDELIGIWQAYGIYQEARASDYTTSEALLGEQQEMLYIGYDEFSTTLVSVVSPVYKLGTSSYDTLEEAGIDTSSLKADSGEDTGVVTLDVYRSDGSELAASVYFIDNSRAIYYGLGMHVFSATKLEAVG